MARKHRRRRSRGFGGIVSLPSLGALNPKKIIGRLNPLNKSVKTTDVLIGVAAGMLGSGFIKKGLNSVIPPEKQPKIVQDNIGLVTAALAGLAASFVLGKGNESKANGIAFGGLIAGAIPTAWNHVPASFKGMTDIDLSGFLVSDQDRALSGFLVNDTMNGLAEGHMNALAAHAQGADEDDVLALRAMVPQY